MQIKNSLLIACLLLMIGCKNNKSHLTEKIDAQDTIKVVKKNSAINSIPNTTESIVISCGSGCAISYSPKAITRQNKSIKVVFKANMYEDEILTDSYDETYIFSYTSAQKLDKIIKEGEKVDFLQTQMPEAQSAFIEFSEHLVKINGATNPDIGEHQFIATKKPKLVTLPFSFSQYFNDASSEIKYPSNETTDYLINFLKKHSYDGEAYKSFVIRFDSGFLYLVVTITRGDSEYYVLITTKNNSIVDLKEIGAIGSDNPVTFKILPNFMIEKYKGTGSDASLSEKFKVNESGKIIKQ